MSAESLAQAIEDAIKARRAHALAVAKVETLRASLHAAENAASAAGQAMSTATRVLDDFLDERAAQEQGADA